MKLLLTITLVSLAWQNVNSYPFFDHDYQRTALGDSIDKATLKILKEAYEVGEDKNVITSPLGVLLLLSLYSNGAGAESKQEISNILGGGDFRQLSESYSSLSNSFAEMDPSYLTLANKIYVAKQYELNEGFANTARSYRSEVDKLDFSDSKTAAAVINAWSNEKTRGHIKEPVSEDLLSSDTVAALFNVIFFQGHWHVPFEANQTIEKDFHVDKSTTVKKPTMKLLQSLFYTESEALGAKMVELPYKESGFRMVVVLPNEVDGLPSVLEKATQKGLLEDVFRLSPSGRDVDLEIPKFEIKSKLDLNVILPKVGVSKIFDEAASGVVRGASVKVSKAFQEAFVKVDEEGATAGAFTGFIAAYADSFSFEPPPPPLQFKVDRPFLFTILYEDKMLFSGLFVEYADSVSFEPPPPPLQFKVDRPFLFTILYEDKMLFGGTYTY